VKAKDFSVSHSLKSLNDKMYMKLDQANTPTHVVILLPEHSHANAFEQILQLTGPHAHHKLQSERI